MSMKLIMPLNVKIPTIVGILTFISMINTTSESLKAGKDFIFQHFSFDVQLKFYAQLRLALKKLHNLWARFVLATNAGLKLRVRMEKLIFLFVNQNML